MKKASSELPLPEDELLSDAAQLANEKFPVDYVADFFELARAVLALGGEEIRTLFLKKVGEHLDTWNTQPSHGQASNGLLEKT